MYKYIFGPVPSRRLGMSLGVDLVPKKVCSLDCIYCEVGKTTKLTLEQKEYVLFDNIKEELDHYFSNNPDPDYITFSGSGEPLLNIAIGKVLQYIKKIKSHIPVAVLTNGTMFKNQEVRNMLLDADLVLPSLDAASQDVFEKINRPAKGLLAKDYIQGITEFAREFKGKIWLEVFILPGYNDSEEELLKIKDAILEIKPLSVQLNTLDRPGVISGLVGATQNDMERVMKIWDIDNVQVIKAAPERKNTKSYRKDVATTIMETISRRPCTLDDLCKILGLHVNEVNKYLDVLSSEKKIEAIEEERGFFYQVIDK